MHAAQVRQPAGVVDQRYRLLVKASIIPRFIRINRRSGPPACGVHATRTLAVTDSDLVAVTGSDLGRYGLGPCGRDGLGPWP